MLRDLDEEDLGNDLGNEPLTVKEVPEGNNRQSPGVVDDQHKIGEHCSGETCEPSTLTGASPSESIEGETKEFTLQPGRKQYFSFNNFMCKESMMAI